MANKIYHKWVVNEDDGDLEYYPHKTKSVAHHNMRFSREAEYDKILTWPNEVPDPIHDNEPWSEYSRDEMFADWRNPTEAELTMWDLEMPAPYLDVLPKLLILDKHSTLVYEVDSTDETYHGERHAMPRVKI